MNNWSPSLIASKIRATKLYSATVDGVESDRLTEALRNDSSADKILPFQNRILHSMRARNFNKTKFTRFVLTLLTQTYAFTE